MGGNLGWANALTDSNAVVDLTLNGSALSFTGVGYHDQVRQLHSCGLQIAIYFMTTPFRSGVHRSHLSSVGVLVT